MSGVLPKKGLGQHFLVNKTIAQRIVGALSPAGFNNLIEVGPGTGILTEIILENHPDGFYAIEIDTESIRYLKNKFSAHKTSFLQEDFLKLDIQKLWHKKTYSVIGNLPYFISSQILFKILENRNRINEVVCMLQKEVAERICSEHGSKKYGILSVLLQTFFEVKYLFTVNEGNFHPPPKVKSGVIKLVRNDTVGLPCDENLFFEVVKRGFNQRRKVLRNSLRSILLNLIPQDEIFGKRPEQLSPEEFVKLTCLLEKFKK